VGPVPTRSVPDLLTPVGPTARGIPDLLTPVGPESRAGTQLRPVGPEPVRNAPQLPQPVGPEPTKGVELPAPRGFFDEAPPPRPVSARAPAPPPLELDDLDEIPAMATGDIETIEPLEEDDPGTTPPFSMESAQSSSFE
jgi:hypothetical protein